MRVESPTRRCESPASGWDVGDSIWHEVWHEQQGLFICLRPRSLTDELETGLV